MPVNFALTARILAMAYIGLTLTKNKRYPVLFYPGSLHTVFILCISIKVLELSYNFYNICNVNTQDNCSFILENNKRIRIKKTFQHINVGHM